MKPRALAATALAAVVSGQSLHRILPDILSKAPPERRPLISELVHGTLREWPRMNAIAEALLSKPLKAKDADIYCLILLGLYQLDCMRVPPHAVVSETVNGVKDLRKVWARGLVNGLLRSYQRDQDAVNGALTDAARAALPDWWWQEIGKQWPDDRNNIATAYRSHPSFTLRINCLREQQASYLQRLEAADIAFSTLESHDHAVTITTPINVVDVPGFNEGIVSVQDASAQLAAPLLDLQPGEHVLDACSAPGGKACHMAELQPHARIIAADSSLERLTRVQENGDRLGLTLDLQHVDATVALEHFGANAFDAILADVPCSASGVVRRNPDIKVLRTPDDIHRFAEQQKDIVTGLWPTLKPGGRLLYVTCSIFEEENDDVVEHCLAHLPGATLVAISTPEGRSTRTGSQQLPSLASDGLFFALIRRST